MSITPEAESEDSMANLKTTRSQYGGSIYDQQYFTDDELRRAAEIRQAAERGETDWGSAHNLVEAIRSKYGYSGGTNGAGYTALKQAASETPTYISEFKDEINSLKNALLNREAFSYDYQSDPAYQAYKKQYTREGQRATADTLGQLAAMTGGMPSTAATAAAAQQANYYGAKIADVIPELRSLAYQMYQAEGDNIRDNLSTLLKMDSQAQNLYQFNANRSDQNREQAVSDAQKRIETYLMMGGSVAGIDAATKAAAGYTDAELNQMSSYYKQQAALSTSKSSGSGSSAKTENSADYKSALSKAKSLLESGGENKAISYLEGLVSSGYITADEALRIARVELGLDLSGGTSSSKKASLISESEFNRSSAMQKKWGSYANYLKNNQ